MTEGNNPSAGGHVPESEAPREDEGEARELTEYRQPEDKRDRPGAREKERDAEGR
jgi:hypothetical protein